MNLEIQNYLVYTIVLAALIKFTQPIWTFLYQLFFTKKSSIVEDTSCYTGTCAKCKVKT